jgi:hypothetical protein
MSRTASGFAVFILLLGILVGLPASGRADSPFPAGEQAGGQVTPADAGPFVGEWTLALQGPNGPGTFELRVSVEGEKVAGEISSDTLPKTPIAEISLRNKSLNLGFTFTWQGNPVDAAVSLTPGEEGKMTAQIDFAGGAYVMTGTATKKEKDK